MTDPIPLPSGASVRVKIPHPPIIKASPPTPQGVTIMPTPGIPGKDGVIENVEEVADLVLAELESDVDLVLQYNNIRSQG